MPDLPLQPLPAPRPVRRWRGRVRLAAAIVASLLVHWLLQQGLARTVLDIRPLDGLFPDREPSFKPEVATDFPLQDDTSRRESFAHEQPLEVALAVDAAAPAAVRGVGREGKRGIEPEALPELPEAPDVSAERIDRPATIPDAAVPGEVSAPLRAEAVVPEPVTTAETTEMTVGTEDSEPVPRAPRERVTLPQRALSTAAGGAGGAEALPEVGVVDVVPLAGLVPRRFARSTEPVAALATPRTLERADVAAASGGGDAAAAVGLLESVAGSADESPLQGSADAPGDGLLPRPAARSTTRGAGRQARSSGSSQRTSAGLETGGDGAEGLSVALVPGGGVPLVSTLRPRVVPGSTLAAGPAPTATPLPRARALVLPAETRVRETAEAFARRSRENRGAAEADAMVERGLEWLARSQESDGRWTLGKYDPAGVGGAVRLQSDSAATGLALLSFLGAGYDHFDGRHREAVRRGLEWLVSVQHDDGDLYQAADPVSNSCARMYSHGIATTALCEAVGMTGDPLLRPAAEKALAFVVASQQPGRGGWRYQPRSDSDLSVTGWMLVSLRAGALAGLSVPAETFAAVESFLDTSAVPGNPGHYLYNATNPGQRPSDLSAACMTALGALMRLHTGTPRGDEPIREAAAELAKIKPSYGSGDVRARDAYLWYYSSQVLVQTGGVQWEAWYRQLCRLLESKQIASGSDAGSWDPLGPIPDRWGAYGGRLYVTTLHLLALEVPYRHLPTYGVTGADSSTGD